MSKISVSRAMFLLTALTKNSSCSFYYYLLASSSFYESLAFFVLQLHPCSLYMCLHMTFSVCFCVFMSSFVLTWTPGIGFRVHPIPIQWKWKCYLLSHVQRCVTPMDCSPPGSSVHGILQARILEWVAIPFSRGPSRPRDQIQVSRIAGRFFTVWVSREAPFQMQSS